MRIPKYRAWHIAEKKMYQVYAISYMDKKNTEDEPEWRHTNNIQQICINDFSDQDLYEKPYWIEASNCILLQDTGLEDKHGKKIWEGDIVLYEYNQKHYSMKFSQGEFLLTKNDVNLENLSPTEFDYGLEVQIVGNIYENPELLEAK